jgi:hypothetical protein
LKLIFFFLAFLYLPAWASFSGSLKSSTDFYPAHLGEPTDDVTPYVILDVNGKHKLNKKLRVQWRGYALSNPDSKSAPENLYGDLPEAFFEWKAPADFKLKLGMNTVNWGVVDVSSPSDVVNPSAFFHPLRLLKRGSPMIDLAWNKEVIGFEAIYIPRQQKSLLPSTDSRWLPRKLLLNLSYAGDKILLPDFIEYQYTKDEILDHALDHNAGLRLSSHLGSVDLYLMHFEGAAPQPKVRPKITINSGPSGTFAASPVVLRPLYYRVRTSSLGAVYAGEKWIFRVESAYQHSISQDPLIQPWAWSSVAAIETNFNLGSSTLTVLGQYYYAQNPQESDNLITSTYRLFDRTGVLGFRWPVSETLLLTGSVLYETKTRGKFLMAGFEQKLSDVLRWGMGWRDFSAEVDGLLKTYDKNDHANLELIYFF